MTFATMLIDHTQMRVLNLGKGASQRRTSRLPVNAFAKTIFLGINTLKIVIHMHNCAAVIAN